ncbi:unnamed protein product [Mytilus coruscus]|uniref:Uncharacterized protein n=1 Tax=Mytilus coruscus TaxID=42192 RepID=A0A6J8CFH9_MYTCO|nr:unnamed protein product [Mytilus coruscus]
MPRWKKKRPDRVQKYFSHSTSSYCSLSDIREKWVRYYLNGVQGKNIAYLNHMKNTESGSFLIPIDKHSSVSHTKEDAVEVRLVSPSVQMVDMAKETLKEEGISIDNRKRKPKDCKKKNISKESKNKKRKKPDVFFSNDDVIGEYKTRRRKEISHIVKNSEEEAVVSVKRTKQKKRGKGCT